MRQNDLCQQTDTVQVRWLNVDDIDAVMQLQDVVCRELRRIAQGHFFVPLTREGRLEVLQSDHAVAGLFEHGRLVAHMVFYRLNKQNLLKARYHSLSLQPPQTSKDDYYIISEMVAPDCRRRGYMSQLADWAIADLYFESPTVNPNLWATVSCVNMGGLHCNIKLGLRIQEEGLNLVDGTPVYLLHGKLLPESIRTEEPLLLAA